MYVVKNIGVKVIRDFLEPFKEFNSIDIRSDIFTNINWNLLEFLSSKKGLFTLDGILTPVDIDEKEFEEIPIVPNYIINLLKVFDNSDKINIEYDGNKFYIRGLNSNIKIGGSPITVKEEELKLGILKKYKSSTLFIPDIEYHLGEIPSVYLYDKGKDEYVEHYDIEIDNTTFVNTIIKAIPKFFKLGGSKKKSNIFKNKISLIFYNNNMYVYAFIKERLQRYVQQINIKKAYMSEIVGTDEFGSIENMEVNKIPNAIFTIDYNFISSIKKSDKIIIRIIKSPNFIKEDFSEHIYLPKIMVLYSKKNIDGEINGIYNYVITSLTNITNQLFGNEEILNNEISID